MEGANAPRIGVIGGTGVHDPEIFKNVTERKVYTPYGSPSDRIQVGDLGGTQVAFLPRHGRDHSIPPHGINYRANIWAMRELGVRAIISPNAVGSLQEECAPGDIVLVDQFVDRTRGRKDTFYDGGQVCHVSTADPVCPDLHALLCERAQALGIPNHSAGTYVCIQGPRFSTRAESNIFRSWGASVIGMTMYPESALAREAQICYATVAMVTDYDCWMTGRVVDNEEVVRTMGENIGKVKALLADIIPRISEERDCACSRALQGAVI
jgi:5'-methylthioadenosine phosphorylase